MNASRPQPPSCAGLAGTRALRRALLAAALALCAAGALPRASESERAEGGSPSSPLFPFPADMAAAHPPASTFSILAVDEHTGEIGIATQSKIVAVGAIVPYARGGAGAAASQAYANSSYGPRAIRMLERGVAPREIVESLVAEDPLRDRRQLAVIGVDGDRAVFTGDSCLPWAGSLEGDSCLVAGNLLAGPEVLEAMVQAFESSEGVLAERLLAALQAGEEAGGDRRGRQSAAILVVREGWGYGGIGDRFRDLRVDDSETPIDCLERVYRKHRELFPRPDDS